MDIIRPTEGVVEGILHPIGVDIVGINLIRIIISRITLVVEGVGTGVDGGGGDEVGEVAIILGIGRMCYPRMWNLYLI